MTWQTMTAADMPNHVGRRVANKPEDMHRVADRIVFATEVDGRIQGATRDGRFNLPPNAIVYIDPDQ